ncbi:GFA family protein [Sphingomonas sp. GC_Shp_3]|uniref:GFA family protein n=1 Tax=Sphingomonas sp. GC_Shp_3 TaxID=2937383 RepID=UPI00226A60B7|nr:GFA family protein [Sphingomonas sp. GC_Shp_3]
MATAGPPEMMTGGCQCGRIRYAVQIDSDDAYLCHCRMCQCATGGVSIALKGVAIADLTWTTQAPDRYRSSPIAQRGFCRECGTPLTFEFVSPDETMDVTVGSFDHPGRFVPRHNFATESLHEAWIDTHTLPRIRSEDNPSTSNRWMDAVGKLPD